jgi:two-component system chemotaxis response regulator CheB
MIRVVIADDSALFRAVLKSALEADGGIKVVGTASDGDEAVAAVLRHEPDLVTMDVVMPGRGGEEAIREIMRRRPTPVLVVSSLERNDIVFRMLAAGALDVVAKPDGTPRALAALVRKAKEVAAARQSLRGARPRAGRPPPPAPAAAPPTPRASPRPVVRATPGESSAPLVVIASSAGGPAALEKLLPTLPALDVPIVVVQHIAVGFAAGLASWLGTVSAVPVRLARDDAPLLPRGILLAPDDADVEVTPGCRVRLRRGAAGVAHPNADVTIRSAADVYGASLLVVVLTGMGSDGAEGARAAKARGGRVVAQDEETSAVYGMPRAARPHADAVLPLGEIGAEIVRFARGAG